MLASSAQPPRPSLALRVGIAGARSLVMIQVPRVRAGALAVGIGEVGQLEILTYIGRGLLFNHRLRAKRLCECAWSMHLEHALGVLEYGVGARLCIAMRSTRSGGERRIFDEFFGIPC
jgi:hypothetical protein